MTAGSGMHATLLVKAHGQTHVGLIRTENQDRFVILEPDPRRIFLAIADGMGGEAGGGVAADMLMEAVLSDGPAIPFTPLGLSSLLLSANERIQARAIADKSLRHMGTTGLLVGVSEEIASWAHVGDSRLYLSRDGILSQVTRDHSFLQDLLDSGDVLPEEAHRHPFRHVLDQCVGCPACLPQKGSFRLQAGDRLLLCTDGVHDELSDTDLAEALAEDSLEKATGRLIALALEHGGRDNATVVVAKIEKA